MYGHHLYDTSMCAKYTCAVNYTEFVYEILPCVFLCPIPIIFECKQQYMIAVPPAGIHHLFFSG